MRTSLLSRSKRNSLFSHYFLGRTPLTQMWRAAKLISAPSTQRLAPKSSFLSCLWRQSNHNPALPRTIREWPLLVRPSSHESLHYSYSIVKTWKRRNKIALRTNPRQARQKSLSSLNLMIKRKKAWELFPTCQKRKTHRRRAMRRSYTNNCGRLMRLISSTFTMSKSKNNSN